MKRTALIVFVVLFVLAAGILLFVRFFGQQFVEPTPPPSSALVIPFSLTGQVVALTDHSMTIGTETAEHSLEVPSYKYITVSLSDTIPVTLVIFPENDGEGIETPTEISDIRIGSRVRVRMPPEDGIVLVPLKIIILTQ